MVSGTWLNSSNHGVYTLCSFDVKITREANNSKNNCNGLSYDECYIDNAFTEAVWYDIQYFHA